MYKLSDIIKYDFFKNLDYNYLLEDRDSKLYKDTFNLLKEEYESYKGQAKEGVKDAVPQFA